MPNKFLNINFFFIAGKDKQILTPGPSSVDTKLICKYMDCVFVRLCLQCERKETFIQQIQSLDIETQAAIAGCIQQVLSRCNQTKHLQTATPSLSILEEILSSRGEVFFCC